MEILTDRVVNLVSRLESLLGSNFHLDQPHRPLSTYRPPCIHHHLSPLYHHPTSSLYIIPLHHLSPLYHHDLLSTPRLAHPTPLLHSTARLLHLLFALYLHLFLPYLLPLLLVLVVYPFYLLLALLPPLTLFALRPLLTLPILLTLLTLLT